MNDSSSTTSQWLKQATKQLKASGIGTARLDCLVLLEDAAGKDRAWLLAHPEFDLTVEQIDKLNAMIARRVKHEPLAYIRDKSEFYGREFLVTKDTLEPRPETETMIDTLKSLSGIKTVADIGTGSGCIAITVKQELPAIKVLATEVNAGALKIAKQNAQNMGTDVEFYQGDLLEPLQAREIDVLLCNLPYVPDHHTINQAAMQEPKVAIFGGPDGLDLYRRLFRQCEAVKSTYVLTESLPFQHIELAKIALSHDYHQTNEDDFIQLFELS